MRHGPVAALMLVTGVAAASLLSVSPARASGAVRAASGVQAAASASADYSRWLDRDVLYLATDEERKAFRDLSDDAARARFVADFWKRRDPTPRTDENEFRDEHYRRLAEAERRFASGVPGWKTDRGRIYITWGPPDFVETNPAGGRGFALGALSEAPELPTEIWTYEHLPPRIFGSAQAQVVFVDHGGGDYRLLTDPNDVNLACVYRLNAAANPLQYESAAFFDPVTGLKRTDGVAETARAQTLGPDKSGSVAQNQYELIALAAALGRTSAETPDDVRRSQVVRDMEQVVKSEFFARRLPIGLHVPVFATAAGDAYCPLAVSIAGDAISLERGVRYRATLTAHGEVKDLKTGETVRQFTEEIEFRLAKETHARGVANGFSYHKPLTLPPGEYRVDVIVKQPSASALGVTSVSLRVPEPSAGPRITGLVLAEGVGPARTASAGPFTLGAIDVVPRPLNEFGTGDTLYAVYQVAGFASVEGGPRVSVDYIILRGETEVVLRTDIQQLEPASLAEASSGGAGILMVRAFTLEGIVPGDYILQVKAIDHTAWRHSIVRGSFRVR
ncbi:MAG: GWxTD domain-containing protein [Vicinamibacterales bacterium]